ncbi:lymphocyte antigen 75-like isoform X1 [Phyllopteryx taeniolatus]|uniref:lymphocyte antigen 75-like isoform X1 n=1 Tax=Phyllopteryx taeniolatus TaxID=161469 RepID=UPI002AD51931|nr:lymphocyte antigen 75-like isoform X1 [Phyllopteryx taeniolatus]
MFMVSKAGNTHYTWTCCLMRALKTTTTCFGMLTERDFFFPDRWTALHNPVVRENTFSWLNTLFFFRSSTISDTRCHMLKPPLSPKPSGGTVDAGRGQKGPYSQAHCQLFGGNLASVHSDDENAFIRTLTQGTTWLGGSNCQTTGAWLWMDGTQMLFRFWCPLKPDNDLTQCCLQTNTGGGKRNG